MMVMIITMKPTTETQCPTHLRKVARVSVCATLADMHIMRAMWACLEVTHLKCGWFMPGLHIGLTDNGSNRASDYFSANLRDFMGVTLRSCHTYLARKGPLLLELGAAAPCKQTPRRTYGHRVGQYLPCLLVFPKAKSIHIPQGRERSV